MVVVSAAKIVVAVAAVLLVLAELRDGAQRRAQLRVLLKPD
jgi:hypothetical protein